MAQLGGDDGQLSISFPLLPALQRAQQCGVARSAAGGALSMCVCGCGVCPPMHPINTTRKRQRTHAFVKCRLRPAEKGIRYGERMGEGRGSDRTAKGQRVSRRDAASV
eukprot:scaffold1518_cov109-Isochrysis_galbana.AAC.3